MNGAQPISVPSFAGPSEESRLGSFAQNFAVSQQDDIPNCQRAAKSETFSIRKVRGGRLDISYFKKGGEDMRRTARIAMNKTEKPK